MNLKMATNSVAIFLFLRNAVLKYDNDNDNDNYD